MLELVVLLSDKNSTANNIAHAASTVCLLSMVAVSALGKII